MYFYVSERRVLTALQSKTHLSPCSSLPRSVHTNKTIKPHTPSPNFRITWSNILRRSSILKLIKYKMESAHSGGAQQEFSIPSSNSRKPFLISTSSIQLKHNHRSEWRCFIEWTIYTCWAACGLHSPHWWSLNATPWDCQSQLLSEQSHLHDQVLSPSTHHPFVILSARFSLVVSLLVACFEPRIAVASQASFYFFSSYFLHSLHKHYSLRSARRPQRTQLLPDYIYLLHTELKRNSS